MGNSPPPKKFDPKSEKSKFEITCIKVRSYLELQRDRRQNAANGKEKFLIQMFNSPTRSKQDEIQKASSIITDLNYVKASNIIIRFCDILKDNSLRVMEAKGHSAKIENLLPYIESVCWSSKPLNLSCIVEFQSQMIYFFGADITESIQKSSKVDPDLKACFKDLLPTPLQINDYMVAFANRIGLPLSQINAAGHEFAGGSYGGPSNEGGGCQYLQFQIPPQELQAQNQIYLQPQNYPPPMQFIEQPPHQQINPSFGAFQPTFEQQQVPNTGNYGYPPNQFGGFQNQGNQMPPPSQQGPPSYQPPTYQTPTYQPPTYQQPPPQNYPEFGGINIPKGREGIVNGSNAGGGNSSQLPNLDDFEERMKKLRENL